jgi:hypothetical protein
MAELLEALAYALSDLLITLGGSISSRKGSPKSRQKISQK